MASATLTRNKQRLKLGPGDCGRRLSEKQFLHAEYAPGYQYELIEGRLDVVSLPRQSHDWIERWLMDLLKEYVALHPDIANHVTPKAVVYVPGLPDTTRPEPDIVLYQNFPLDRGPDVEWEEVSPILVVEILSEGGVARDLVRNVRLYARIPTIREYWTIDGLADPRQPTMTVRRRKGMGWQSQLVRFGETYVTRLLPGFVLKLDPMAK
jgi:Uma2 family endonuclease